MADELRLTRALADEMIAHCLAGRPNEACGILGARDGVVVKLFKMSNAAASPLRYSLEPKEQLAVYRNLDDSGMELGGVFHSHTRTQAYPSPTDVRLASEDVPYVIVSLASDPPAVRGFRIIKDNWIDEHGAILEIPVVISDVLDR